MINTIIFDMDDMVVLREMYFSHRFSREFGVPPDQILPFFTNEFQLCLVGKADLKQELAEYIKLWNWSKTIDDLLLYWFEHENTLNQKILASVKELRGQGFKCCLNTNNEKYRVRYLFDKIGLKNYFDAAYSSSELGFAKPQAKFWEAIYTHLGKPNKSEVLVWDNDEKNIQSAKDFGFWAETYSSFANYQNRMKQLVG